MKIYFSSDLGKGQAETLKKCGVTNRLVSFYRIQEMRPETAKKRLEEIFEPSGGTGKKVKTSIS